MVVYSAILQKLIYDYIYVGILSVYMSNSVSMTCYTFTQCVGSFLSPGIDSVYTPSRRDQQFLVSLRKKILRYSIATNNSKLYNSPGYNNRMYLPMIFNLANLFPQRNVYLTSSATKQSLEATPAPPHEDVIYITSTWKSVT